MRRLFFAILILAVWICLGPWELPVAAAGNIRLPLEYIRLREEMINRFSGPAPQKWGEHIPGVRTRLDTDDKVVALTLDACGTTDLSKGYDAELIRFLEQKQIPATLFLSAIWIEANPGIAARLAANPLFEIENHGLRHRPASTTGRSTYGLPGTQNVGELVDEVELGARQIKALTGKRPKFYRSGTAFYDERALRVIETLGYQAVNYSVLGDAGATFNREQVRQAVLRATPGSIIICHMNHPESETAEGLHVGLIELMNKGYQFVKLEQYTLK